ncbi:MAG: GspH/FimT family pseudopilin [Acidobacteriota bacterium]
MRERGFSLVDLMVTCLLLGTVVGIGLNSWDTLSTQHRLQSACQSLISDLWRARVASLAGNLPVAIEVRGDRAAYSVVEHGETPVWRELPPGVRFSDHPKTKVTFYSRGSAVPGGTYTLENPSGKLRVIVAASGRFRWQRLE